MYNLKDFSLPIEGGHRITSGEGPRESKRTTNGKRMSSFHPGTDWAGRVPGSRPDIHNITGGTVVFAGKAGGYGNAVVVKNPDGTIVQYGHLDSIHVKVGDHVPSGGKIGVMGATGNVTGPHLDLIVVNKDGQAIKRDGTPLTNAPVGVLRRAGLKGGKGKQPPPQLAEAAPATAPTVEVPSTPLVSDQAPPLNMLGNTPLALLSGVSGVVVPDTPTQNTLFSGIADMGLSKSLETVYAESAKAIADIKDNLNSEPMLQSSDPLRNEISSLFDRIEV